MRTCDIGIDIVREIKAKGVASRFRKTERGMFERVK